MAGDFTKALSDAARDNQFVVLGDMDHRETGIIRAIITPDNMQAMAAQGVTHMFMERTASASHVINAYQDGTLSFDKMKTALRPYGPDMLGGGNVAHVLTPEQFQDHVDLMAESVRAAKEAGIRMHFVEHGAGSDVLGKMAQAQQAYIANATMAAITAYSAQNPAAAAELMSIATKQSTDTTPAETQRIESFMTQWMNDHPDERTRVMAGYNTLNQNLEAEHARLRIDADRGLAAEIVSITGTGKGVVIYGGAHGMHANDLDNFLPSSTRILVAASPASIDLLRPTQDDMMDKARLPDPKQAEGIYLVQSGQYVRNNNTSLAAACATPGIEMNQLKLCQLGEPDAAAPESPSGPRVHLRQSTPGGMGGL